MGKTRSARRIALLAIGVLAWGCASSDTEGSSSGQPNRLSPGAMSCLDATSTDVAKEPSYSADYLYRWTTYDGCGVRLDFVMTRRGACFTGVDEILMGWPLGSTHTHHDNRIYLRDPEQVSGAASAADFKLESKLPSDALDTGLRQDHVELWMIPGEDEYIWLVDSQSIERWPLGSVACA